MTDEKQQATFSQLMRALQDADDQLDQYLNPDFDLPTLVGDIRDKVDAIYYVHTRMQSYASYLREMAAPLLEKAKSLDNQAERLKEYVQFNMVSSNLEKVPGNLYRVQLQNNSKPTVNVERPADANDYFAFKGFVKQKVSYEWDKTAISSTDQIPSELPAQVSQGRHVRFYPNVPETLEKKKGKK